MAEKQVKVKVATDVELSKVESLEKRLAAIKSQKIQLMIDAKTEQLEKANERINHLKKTIASVEAVPPHLRVNVDDAGVEALKSELASLEHKTAKLELDIEKSELEKAKAEVEELDNETIDIDMDVNDASLQMAMTNISMGVQVAKQGISELASNMGDVLESAGRLEQTEAFLSMNMGADVAKQKLEEIRSVTDSLPGDDVTLQNLLSQATLKDASMTTSAFKQMGSAAADYMAAMQNFGKTSTETQQDLMNYILAGNTAEIERSPILQSHIDKLKEGTTVQERAKLLQEALTEEGWAGIASQDIYNNKQQQFNDMLERGKTNLGDMFLKGTEGAADYLIQLDNATNGLVGMGIAAADMVAGPFVDVFTGLGQIATGVRALKELELGATISKWVSGFTDLAKATLAAGYAALKSAAMWVIEKAQVVASTIAKGAATLASYALAAAEFLVASPILLLIIIIGALIGALIYLYNTNEDVRNAINGLGQTFLDIGNMIMSALQGVWDYITSMGGLIPEQVSLTGNSIVDSILGVIGFLLTLPLQLGMIFTNMLAKTMGFGDNFVQRMFQTALNSVTAFIGQIKNMYNKLVNELNNMLNAVKQWASQLWQRFKQAALDALNAFLGALGIHSPGIMQVSLIREITDTGKRIPNESRNLLYNIGVLGSDIVDEFGNPTLDLAYNTNGKFLNNTVASSGNSNSSPLGGVTINIEIGSVDNEERVNEIVDAIIHRLTFENATAGRTV